MIDKLREKANQLGLQAVGVASAIAEVRAAYPWAESVVSAAICYLPPEHKPSDDVPRGSVARVAQGADYHTVLREKLSQLSEVIRAGQPEARVEICVDTGPLPERKLAVLAGIAWRGKSGNVFVEGCGSYAALGEIVTDARLPGSEPIEIDRCGDCAMCMLACPTGAITAPGVVDAARCLSQLTQASGEAPREMRKAMGDRIYGCDICQEVCPQNAQVESVSPEFAAEVFPGPCPELVPLIDLSAAEFRERVRDSSIGWIRRTRIRRNAAIAAGNLRCGSAVPALDRMLRDTDPMLRAQAAWSLGMIGSEEAIRALHEALERESDPAVIEEIRAWLPKGQVGC